SSLCCIFQDCCYPLDIVSFPTRRSSDLWMVEITGEEGAYEARVVESAVRSQVQIHELKQIEDHVGFQMAIDDQTWPFDGVLLARSEEHTSELQSRVDLVCRLRLEKKKKN